MRYRSGTCYLYSMWCATKESIMTGKRDELGRFKPGYKLSDEHVEKMVEGAKVAREAKSDDRKRDLLTQMGYIEPFSVDVDSLADMFLAGKANSISAHTKLLQRSPVYKDTVASWDPDSGEPCPMCAGASADTLSKLIAEHPGLLDAILKFTDVEIGKLAEDSE